MSCVETGGKSHKYIFRDVRDRTLSPALPGLARDDDNIYRFDAEFEAKNCVKSTSGSEIERRPLAEYKVQTNQVTVSSVVSDRHLSLAVIMKSALVIGATRGIGRQIALTLAENGYGVCVAAKTVVASDKTPGSIFDVVTEISNNGGRAIPMKCDVRSEADINATVDACVEKYGHLDVAVYNAGAVLWKSVVETPLRRWDLMNEVNARGAYTMIQKVLPHMLERKTGRLLLVCPPIYNRFFKGKTPYSMTKVAMSVLVHGLANELVGTGVSVSGIWPATVVESHVTTVKSLPPAHMRKSTIFADACLGIVSETTEKLNGKVLIDEDYLRSEGVTDFTKYRCDPDHEPGRMMPKKIPSLLVEEELEDPLVTSRL